MADIAWHPDGSQIASGSSNLMVNIWDISSSRCLKQLHSHHLYIWGVAWSPDGRQIASCGEEGTVHIWNAATGTSVHVLQDPAQERESYFSLAWSPDGRWLAVGSYAQGVLIWDRITQTVRRVGPTDLPVWMRTLQWSPDGACLAAPGPGGVVFLWDTATWSLRTTLAGHQGRVTSLAWSPDGSRLATGSAGRGSDYLLIWDVDSGQRLRVLEDPQ